MIQYVCGVHFCDRCGDCMYCYGDDFCTDSENHYYDPVGDEENEKYCSICGTNPANIFKEWCSKCLEKKNNEEKS